jgi:hypothetical protein
MPHPRRLDRQVQSRLGAELRSLLAGIEGEPLPSEHVYLLLALRQRERALRRHDS